MTGHSQATRFLDCELLGDITAIVIRQRPASTDGVILAFVELIRISGLPGMTWQPIRIPTLNWRLDGASHPGYPWQVGSQLTIDLQTRLVTCNLACVSARELDVIESTSTTIPAGVIPTCIGKRHTQTGEECVCTNSNCYK